MPISVKCDCGARLNAPDAAAGKRVKCPKCAAVLTVPAPEDDFEVVDDEPAPPKRRPARAADEDEDEDDRPVNRRSRREDDDEDDDRPAKRRSRRDEDDEDDDRPRPRKKKGKKAAPKSNLPLLLGIGGGVLALAVVGIVVAFVLLNTDDKQAKGPNTPPPANIPGARTGPQPNADWEEFEQPEFSIQMPRGGQPPQRNGQAEARTAAQFPGGKVWAKAGPTGTAYLVMVLPMPPQLQQEMNRNRDQALKNFAAGMVMGVPGANLQSNTEVTINGQPGRQVVLGVGPGKSVNRIYISDTRIYAYSVTGPIQSENDPQAKPFFESFQPK